MMIRAMILLLQRFRYEGTAEEYHTELVEKICELDDDLMMMYLEGESLQWSSSKQH